MSYLDWTLAVGLGMSAGLNIWLLWQMQNWRLYAYRELKEQAIRHNGELAHRDAEIRKLKELLPVHGEHGRFVRRDGAGHETVRTVLHP